MEHEVFVPFPAGTVRQALVDPARLARCVPGLQPDADAAAQSPDTLIGRLRLRIAGSTITYRGSLQVTEQDGGDLTVEAQGTEVRGDGSAKVALIIRPTSSRGGTILGCTGTVTSRGRLADADPAAATATARRLLDRFGTRLTSVLRETRPGTDEPASEVPEERRAAEPGAEPDTEPGSEPPGDHGPGEDTAPEARGPAGPPEATDGRTVDDERRAGPAAVNGSAAPDGTGDAAEAPGEEFTEEQAAGPAASEEPASDGTAPGDAGAGAPVPADGPGAPETPPDGALARRTMVGRSAEEVDHAPPRGRYAPVPAPEPLVVGVTLRWAAPAAAVVVASAVVVNRLLRRRRP
ncbi:hypothetical protein [Streptomyces meridianus]|uniref:Carbon monoxide dehydrogenase subunit G n=1 Tax=Streptomyces meridianus TaxID=2938945 RepID=A0ABT0X5E6_9ACTN|nr:hypothetical protein [Streptomyces meridianus]MCM2577762.1 hypothetical protein [Streptomyces meridianus]